MTIKIEIGVDQANEIAVEVLMDYFIVVYEESYDSQKWDTLLALDTVLSHIMNPREYEDFTNGISKDAFSV
jgi:hypothetical protein|tara:strand:- start:2185 stop:2397 length:213 start_codon:yes stop_codon:yes gene_type:complete